MHGTPMFQVAQQGDGQAIQVTEFLPDRESIQQGLGGVFADSITGVNDRFTGCLSGDGRRTDFRVAQHDHIRIALQRTDGVYRLSPFETDEYFTSLIGMTEPPSRSIAAVNDEEVLVDGS